MMRQAVSIKGNGVEHVGGVEGAVDRIAVEILRRLEQGRTLVIWAFDASGSLQAERQRLSKHIETIYTHITQLDENHLSADQGLLTLVVAFGEDRKAMTPKPTAELSEILEAIGEVPTDETGVESTFTTIAEIVRRWDRYKDSTGQVYHPMIIVVTDEVGDDENRLEESIELAQRNKVPVYVLGSQALFGRVEGYMDYLDPKTKHPFRGVAVRQGPESAVLEQIRLPFWYYGPQFDILEAGFGPYALSRLTSATGGIYFVTRFAGPRMGFDPARIREYKPGRSGEISTMRRLRGHHFARRSSTLRKSPISSNYRGCQFRFFLQLKALNSKMSWLPTKPRLTEPHTRSTKRSDQSQRLPSCAIVETSRRLAGALLSLIAGHRRLQNPLSARDRRSTAARSRPAAGRKEGQGRRRRARLAYPRPSGR